MPESHVTPKCAGVFLEHPLDKNEVLEYERQVFQHLRQVGGAASARTPKRASTSLHRRPEQPGSSGSGAENCRGQDVEARTSGRRKTCGTRRMPSTSTMARLGEDLPSVEGYGRTVPYPWKSERGMLVPRKKHEPSRGQSSTVDTDTQTHLQTMRICAWQKRTHRSAHRQRVRRRERKERERETRERERAREREREREGERESKRGERGWRERGSTRATQANGEAGPKPRIAKRTGSLTCKLVGKLTGTHTVDWS